MRNGFVARWVGLCAWMIAVALAGCSSSSPGASSLPASADVTSPVANVANSSLRLLALQASDELPGPIPRAAIQRELSDAQSHPRPRPFRQPGTVGLWATYGADSEILGYDAKIHTVLDVIDTASKNCFDPNSIKVDHNRDIWVACEGTSNTAPAAGEQEYNSEGVLEHTYAFDATSICREPCGVLSFDGGPDALGHVFSEFSVGSWEGKHRLRGTDPGFFWWDAKQPSRSGTFIRASRYCRPFCQIDYMDTDKSGNIWFDFTSTANGYIGGLAEVTNPTTAPSIRVIFPGGTYRDPGGVYVSRHGKVLNVTDQETRETYQYLLPVTPSSKPFNELGPSTGSPVQGGFNKTETSLALGGEYSGIQVGKLPDNTWKNSSCGLKYGDAACVGSAYTPSDK